VKYETKTAFVGRVEVRKKLFPNFNIRVCVVISRRMSDVDRSGPDKHKKANYRDNRWCRGCDYRQSTGLKWLR